MRGNALGSRFPSADRKTLAETPFLPEFQDNGDQTRRNDPGKWPKKKLPRPKTCVIKRIRQKQAILQQKIVGVSG